MRIAHLTAVLIAVFCLPAADAGATEPGAAGMKLLGDGNTDTGSPHNVPREARWPSLMAAELGLTVSNSGRHGAGIDALEELKARAGDAPRDYAVFMYGTEDARREVTARWKADYKLSIQAFLAAGHPASKVIVVSPMYNPDAKAAVPDGDAYLSRLAQVRAYCREIASELGVRFVDLYGGMAEMYAVTEPYTVYKQTPAVLCDGPFFLSRHGHRYLADLIRQELHPPAYKGGKCRAKLFGAGSAMAGPSTHLHSFVRLFGDKTARHSENYAVAGTGVVGGGNNLDALQKHAADGERDIVFLLYGNNDGSGNPKWKADYKEQIRAGFLEAGYEPKRVVLMTVTMAPGLETAKKEDWDRMRAANVSIREIAAELGLTLVDLERRYAKAEWYADDYHLNDVANADLADHLATLIP